jgi:predicted amidophosphoribosyltransferase
MTPPQKGLSAAERRKNLQTAFVAQPEVDGQVILLVDDIMTSGETARCCAGALKKAGAKAVHIAVVARAG